ncbi:HD-GYP domain-containing protein [Methylobacterium sp. J-077]|uniref:HD-GYP domain-containing protein n=1 Tax=Methylobacterium sp. J-077 TaxID=2836656 RepID=UPI001FBB0A43|nr:HD domain-containing phosphohydrolase [Methylobacterium sp. J-077]MCJ2124146.1 HD domain-containing protein [Methylobacterium sp. J-077]
MNAILFLTDAPARGRRFARNLETLGSPVVIDLLDPFEVTEVPSRDAVMAVVSDLSLSRSPQVAGLRKHLDRLGPRRPPLLCLMHEDTPRARAQAQALGADRILKAEDAAGSLAQALYGLIAAKPDSDAVTATTASVAAADHVLERMFDLGRSGRAPEASLIADGAILVVDALSKADIRTWLDVVLRFDDATHQHCLLVAGLAAGFGQKLGLGRSDCERLTQAALLHDLGKSRIPLSILNKPGRLDAEEMAVMRRHPVLGHEMLCGQDYPDEMLGVVRSHHEALDGSGYPDNLRAHQIPDLVRLVTVCDVFGALIERRPYKRALNGGEAYAILKGMAGKVDLDMVRAFRALAETSEAAVRAFAS